VEARLESRCAALDAALEAAQSGAVSRVAPSAIVAVPVDTGRACWHGRSLEHRNGQLLGLRSAGIGPDGDEEPPLERRRRSCGECGRGAAVGLEGALSLLVDIGRAC
jgi:hypothetical protein